MTIGTMDLRRAPTDDVDAPPRPGIAVGTLVRRIAAVGAVGAIVAAGVVLLPDVFDTGADPVVVVAARDTEVVEVRDLSLDVEATGTIEYADAITVVHRTTDRSPGVVTAAPEVDDLVAAGDELYRVNDQPVVLMVGSEPFNRTLEEGVDDGADVAVLEENLVALGYDPDATMTVDETFTSATAAVVEAWQEDLGVEVTGVVELGDVVVMADEVRVAGVSAEVRSSVSDRSDVVQTTSTDRVVQFTVAAADIATIGVGDDVVVQLADRSDVIATIETTEPAANGAVLATAVTSTAVLDGQPGSSVDVTWSSQSVTGAMSVLASAVTRVEGMGYALEVVDGTGTRYVPVEVGIVDGQYAEVWGDGLEPGMTVVSP
ncbi:MAG: peptidoglycan-binding domain-containing protein [Actinomycetota bacterium]